MSNYTQEEIDAIELEHDEEIKRLRAQLSEELRGAETALKRAIVSINVLSSDRVFDVEIAEGDGGRYAPRAIEQMLVTIAGVKAMTVDAPF